MYSLNPVALRQGAFDHSLEYLPGAPVSQTYEKQEQEVTERIGPGRDLTADSRNKPSFIPLATSQDHNTSQYSASSRMAASPVSHKHNPPVTSSDSMQPHIQASMEDYTKQHSAVPTVVPVPQLPHNGHVPLVYPYSGSPSVNYGMPGHGQISSNIVMYPPSQAHFTQARTREATISKPQPIVTGTLNIPPGVQNQAAPPGTKVVHTASSSVSPLYSSHLQMSGQPSIDAQVHVQTAQPVVSQQPAVFNTMEPLPGVPQGFSQGMPKPPHATSHRLSHEMPPAGPEEDLRLTCPGHFKNPESIGQGAAAAAVTSAEVSDLKHNQEQPPRQVYVQAAPKMEHASKSRGFAPVSRGIIGGLPANHQLRERLQNLANRQKTSTGKTGSQDVGSVHQNKGESKEGKVHV